MDTPESLEAKRTLALQQIALTLQSILKELSALRTVVQKSAFDRREE